MAHQWWLREKVNEEEVLRDQSYVENDLDASENTEGDGSGNHDDGLVNA